MTATCLYPSNSGLIFSSLWQKFVVSLAGYFSVSSYFKSIQRHLQEWIATNHSPCTGQQTTWTCATLCNNPYPCGSCTFPNEMHGRGPESTKLNFNRDRLFLLSLDQYWHVMNKNVKRFKIQCLSIEFWLDGWLASKRSFVCIFVQVYLLWNSESQNRSGMIL